MKARAAFAALVASAIIIACSDDDPTGSGNSARDYGALLSGNAVRPLPVTTGATGTATIHVTSGTSDIYDPNSDHLANFTYSVSVTGLSGPAMSAHVHGPAGTNDVGAVLASLTITSQATNGIVSNGTFIGTENPQVSGDSLVVLLTSASAYVDIHTAANGGGEVRGQAFLVSAFRVAPTIRR